MSEPCTLVALIGLLVSLCAIFCKENRAPRKGVKLLPPPTTPKMGCMQIHPQREPKAQIDLKV